MKINNIIILFLLQKVRRNKQGVCPIRCRITYNKKRKEFSTGLFINPDYWNNKKQKAFPSTIDNDYINTQMSLIKQKINQAFLFLQVQKNEFNVYEIYNQFTGVKPSYERTILEVFVIHISRQEKLIGVSTTKVSVAKFYQTQNHIKSFLRYHYNKQDFKLKDLKMSFIEEFEYYLKSEKKFKQNTIYKTLQRFKQVIKLAVVMDYLVKDPFLQHKNSKPKKRIVFLTNEELKKIEEYEFASSRLQQVADMFIFCCYTGLAFTEMNNLRKRNIITGFDDEKWIKVVRQKTDKEINIPILSKALEVLDKYKDDENLLPIISNQKFNSYLKEIADIVSIDKHLTHHIARKTFATTILLYNDIPMEIVSELLGHSSLIITQNHYAKVVQTKVNEHIKKLDKKLK